jgi:hypothetical protein
MSKLSPLALACSIIHAAFLSAARYIIGLSLELGVVAMMGWLR